MNAIPYQPYFEVYTLFHSKCETARHLAGTLYGAFCRDPTAPESRGLGIPMYFRAESRELIPLPDNGGASFTAIVALIDDQMVVDRAWDAFFGALLPTAAKKAGVVILPVALTNNAFNLHPQLTAQHFNFVRLYGDSVDGNKESVLKREVAHAFCRLLAGDDQHDYLTRPPRGVRVFLSHAKVDGEIFAAKLRDWLQEHTGLDRFFDATSIPPGTDFEALITAGVEDSAFLAIQSDVYSSRIWCRRELLLAKRNQIPILVINALNKGEVRSFPYSGNSPTMRWDGDMSPIVEKLLLEVLRYRYFRGLVDSLAHLRPDFARDKCWVFPRPPELLTLQEIIPRDIPQAAVVYPDPTLTKEELDVLQRNHPKLRIFTPVGSFAAEALQSGEPVKNALIAFSISEAEDWNALGLDRLHQDDVFVELCRYLLVSGASIAYGGDLRRGGYTEILWQLVESYQQIDSNVKPIRNYQSWPIYLGTDIAQMARLKQILELVKSPLPGGLAERFQVDAEKPLETSDAQALYLWGRSLTAMREKMNRDASARILIGGRLTGFKGRYPGLIEEAYVALRDRKPLFVAGGFGGCTKAIADWAEGRPEAALSFRELPGYKDLERFYKAETDSGHCSQEDTVDLEKLKSVFGAVSPGTLDAAFNNGLSNDENALLLVTRDIPLMVHLVLKGLRTKALV